MDSAFVAGFRSVAGMGRVPTCLAVESRRSCPVSMRALDCVKINVTAPVSFQLVFFE